MLRCVRDVEVGMKFGKECPLLAENIGTLMMMIMALADSLWSSAMAMATNVQIATFRRGNAE